MKHNPFAESAATIPSPNAIMVFDFETVPDESRFPRPTFDPTATSVPNLDCEQFFTVCKTVADVTKYLSTNMLSVEQYERLFVVEAKTDKPRKGVLEALEDCKLQSLAVFELWKKDHSTNPLTARIVAFGWSLGHGPVESLTATNDDEERAICEKFWSLVATGRRRCGYNITGFDDTLIGVRSLLLGVAPSIKLVRKKYGSRQSLDLMQLLFPASAPQKLKDVCAWLQIKIPAGAEMDGSKVFDLFHAGKMDEIAAYVCSDVAVERELMWRITEVFAE